MRSLVLAIIALLLGSVFTLIAVNASRQATAYPNGMMSVMAAQMKALDGSIKHGQCNGKAFGWRLQTMRLLATDVEAAFASGSDDKQFAADAGDLRQVLDTALAATPNTCAQANQLLDTVNASCHNCHRDFRD